MEKKLIKSGPGIGGTVIKVKVAKEHYPDNVEFNVIDKEETIDAYVLTVEQKEKRAAYQEYTKMIEAERSINPMDDRIRPVYIKLNGNTHTTMAISDGKGNMYKTYSEGYDAYSDVPKPENLLDPKDYVFERGMTSFDF